MFMGSDVVNKMVKDCQRLSQPRVIVWLEGLGQLNNPMTSLGIKYATFQLVA
jgi:hypothetical protein